MEINNLPVELTVVWNGHFNIDNPAQNKGVEGGPRRQGDRAEGGGGPAFEGTHYSIPAPVVTLSLCLGACPLCLCTAP